jgi:hypothetical protein
MKSPFPGMDPYLEQFWPDVHASLIIYARDQLEEQLPSSLIARVEERVVLEAADTDSRAIYPDVKITERAGERIAETTVRRSVAVMEPVIVEYQTEPATETYINILEAGPGQRLVTVIEVLSLSNKLPGDGQRQYRQKQQELRKAGVGLVEIDLLRRGERVLSLPLSRIPRRVRTMYQVCARRGWHFGRFEVYPVSLRSPLPAIRIPLRQQDQDIRLDLQAVLDQAYRKGRYHLTIDYSRPADPPLTGVDARWAATAIRSARKKNRDE